MSAVRSISVVLKKSGNVVDILIEAKEERPQKISSFLKE